MDTDLTKVTWEKITKKKFDFICSVKSFPGDRYFTQHPTQYYVYANPITSPIYYNTDIYEECREDS